LSGAQVFIGGTTIGGVTNDRGEYRITSAPARQVDLRVRLIGYSPINKTVVVTAGQTVTQNIEVGVSALQLEQVVVTGTGAQVEVKKLGNTISTIQPPAFAPITTPSQLLQARDAGVSILPASGITGEGARIRIRGNASLSMSNEPIVFVDGVRINSGGGFGANVGSNGGTPSRLDDIDLTVNTAREAVPLSLSAMDDGSWVIFELPGFATADSGAEHGSLAALRDAIYSSYN
jgi:hypothetical protein